MSDENDGACCAHLCVEWSPVKHGPCTFSDRWRCKDCEHEFVPFGRFSALTADLARVTAERDALSAVGQRDYDGRREMQAKYIAADHARLAAEAERDEAHKLLARRVDADRLSEANEKLAAAEVERDRARGALREIYEQCDSVHILALCHAALAPAQDDTKQNTTGEK